MLYTPIFDSLPTELRWFTHRPFPIGKSNQRLRNRYPQRNTISNRLITHTRTRESEACAVHREAFQVAFKDEIGTISGEWLKQRMGMPTLKLKKQQKPENLGEEVELIRIVAGNKSEDHKSKLGQYLTPIATARFMASLVRCQQKKVRILDAGAGVGTLFAAVVDELLKRPKPPREIEVVAFEIDPSLGAYLNETIASCKATCEASKVSFKVEVRHEDFVEHVCATQDSLFESAIEPFDVAIQNPPYFKIQSHSHQRHMLQSLGIETSNIYTGFLALTYRSWLAARPTADDLMNLKAA
jgi:predicted RNA methylase